MKSGALRARHLFGLLLLAPSVTLLPAAQPALIWSDEFNQAVHSAPDSTKWVYDLGGGGWGNSELETYTDSRDNSAIESDPAATDGKALVITARNNAGAYTSARLKSQGRFTTRFGRIEARLKSTNGQGLWPAFWMLGDNIGTVGWPTCGEIDIMEIINARPAVAYGTLHGPGYSGAHGIGSTYTLRDGTFFDGAYHIFAVDWSPDKVAWSVDGTVYFTVTPASLPSGTSWVFNDTPFFILLNLAVGGSWPGHPDGTTVFPQTYTIDYVRVYGLPPSPPTSFGVIASSAREVTLTWQPATPSPGAAITGYQIERATDVNFTQQRVSFTTGMVTSFSDPSALPGITYFYRISAISAGGISDPSVSRQVTTPAASGSGAGVLSNLSARAYCERGNNVTIGGLVITGASGKRMLLRAVGPTLTAAGLASTEVLADPVIELYQGATVVATNDDWTTNANAADILVAAARLGAMPLQAADTTSSALLITLPVGVYTFIAHGKGDSRGIVLIEAYDADD